MKERKRKKKTKRKTVFLDSCSNGRFVLISGPGTEKKRGPFCALDRDAHIYACTREEVVARTRVPLFNSEINLILRRAIEQLIEIYMSKAKIRNMEIPFSLPFFTLILGRGRSMRP